MLDLAVTAVAVMAQVILTLEMVIQEPLTQAVAVVVELGCIQPQPLQMAVQVVQELLFLKLLALTRQLQQQDHRLAL
jgi:hypothetical protein